MLLSTYRRRRYQSDPGNYRPVPANERPLNTAPITDTQGSRSPNATAQSTDPLLEFDEYGTELHRDARVWKVYVNETDKYDADLVKGWNDSTDVILIFATPSLYLLLISLKQAALFSAISTAFLIESSKMLQPDPAEVSAQALLDISQVLRTIANGSQSAESLEPSNRPADFVPSNTAVCVNTLWYLSLSLSLATSFIAILSKDWCHSFMANRTGHPYPQTLRRQLKWDMLERWKLAELLAVLPSMIHIALLLFSTGLCILLWEMHRTVAFPVICITGVAFSFYIWSSVTAVFLDWFPYPTIVSKLCRTEFARRMAHVVYQVASHLVHNLKLPCLLVGLMLIRTFQFSIAVPGFSFEVLDSLLKNRLPTWHSQLSSHPLLLRLLTAPIYWFLYLFVRKPANKVSVWLYSLFKYLDAAGDNAKVMLTKPRWRLNLLSLRPTPAVGLDDFSAGQSNTTSLAISWLIKNCEVPQSVDIALQSIAGAGKGFTYEPLLECNASVEISKRLASSNTYRGNHVQRIVLLYSRALSFLSSAAHRSANRNQQDIGDDMEVMIWTLQTQFENNVAALITDGQFEPSTQNLRALQIGNTAASHSLKLMKGDHQGPDQSLDSITQFMIQHLAEEPLHPSALLSLVNAASLLSLFADETSVISTLPGLCIRILGHQNCPDTPELRKALVACALLQGKRSRHKKSQLSTLAGVGYKPSEETMQTIIELQAHNGERANMVTEFGLEQMKWRPADYYLGDQLSGIENARSRGRYCAVDINSAAATLRAGAISHNVLQCLQALYTTYRLIHIGSPHVETYEFVLAAICRDPPSRSECWRVFSKFLFPRISRPNLVFYLKEYSVVDLLVQEVDTGHEAMRFFAAGQLWLFFTLDLLNEGHIEWMYASELQSLLDKYAPGGMQGNEARHQNLGNIIEELWNGPGPLVLEPLGVYAYRIIECVLESRHCPIPQHIHDGLRDVPRELRGLSSFLDSWSQPAETSEVEPGRSASPIAEPTDAVHSDRSSNCTPLATGNVEQNRRSSDIADGEGESGSHNDPLQLPEGRTTNFIADAVDHCETENKDTGDEGCMRGATDGSQNDGELRNGESTRVGIGESRGDGSAYSACSRMVPANGEHGEGGEFSREDNELNGPGSDGELGGDRDYIAIDIPKAAQSNSQHD